MKRRSWFFLLTLAVLLLVSPVKAPAAAKKTGWQPIPKYYYYQPDGTLLKKTGLQVINGKTYYLARDYSRYTGFMKVKGSYYYFQKNGVRYEKPGWATIARKEYYFQKDFSLAMGAQKIGRKWYYFGTDGVMQRNSRPFVYKGKYYRTNGEGICYQVSEAQAKASIATWKFINKYSSARSSNAARFQACFKRLLGYMHYRPGYIKMSEPCAKDGVYKCVLKVLGNNVTGNCHGFACTVAACAKELGYSPYVLVLTCDHSVVMIDGKYYDNMGGGKFGARSPYIRNFKIHKKIKY